MRKELDEALVAKYPKIFRDRHGDMTKTLMCWGFSCGDGWYNIIDALCRNIQSHVDSSRRTRARALRFNRALKRGLCGDTRGLIRYYTLPGREPNDWTNKSVERAIADARYDAVPQAVPQIVAVQVKEKFGTLRFYTNAADDYVHGLISMAESMSARTCEECGSPGETYYDGWHVTLCEKHASEQGRSHDIEDAVAEKE